jgi:hypothetical protein
MISQSNISSMEDDLTSVEGKNPDPWRKSMASPSAMPGLASLINKCLQRPLCKMLMATLEPTQPMPMIPTLLFLMLENYETGSLGHVKAQ